MTKEQELIKRDLQEAQYIGEDGGMVVDGRFTKLGAYRKMIKKIAEDCGVEEAWIDFREDDLSIGWLHLVTEKNSEKFEPDAEWYISVRDKSPYSVWVYWG